MNAREALEELYEVANSGIACPQHIGLPYRLCDFSAECLCKSCWLSVIDLYLRGEIDFGEIDDGY
jgi:hypothetical protein